MNYQYRYGGTTFGSVKKLYGEGKKGRARWVRRKARAMEQRREGLEGGQCVSLLAVPRLLAVVALAARGRGVQREGGGGWGACTPDEVTRALRVKERIRTGGGTEKTFEGSTR